MREIHLKAVDFTAFFTVEKDSNEHVSLAKFDFHPKMGKIYASAIRKAKRGKAKEPDGLPMELLKICFKLYAHFLYNMFKAAARLGCVPRDCYESILIPLLKGKELLHLSAGHRSLRLILVFRKIHKMDFNFMIKR